MLLSNPRSRGLRTTHSYNNSSKQSNKKQMGYLDIDIQQTTKTTKLNQAPPHSTSKVKEMGDMNGVEENETNHKAMGNIEPNTLYLTFNAPKVDDYHRGLFLTYPPRSSDTTTSGTLFHATYKESFKKWELEARSISDISKAKTLVLLFRVHTMESQAHTRDSKSGACAHASLEDTYKKMQAVFEKVPMGRVARTKEYGDCPKGNPKLGDYDCVIWTGDALRALIGEGLIEMGGRGVDEVMAEARALAGPQDAREAVGKPLAGLKIR